MLGRDDQGFVGIDAIALNAAINGSILAGSRRLLLIGVRGASTAAQTKSIFE
jgi:hypothetical protein